MLLVSPNQNQRNFISKWVPFSNTWILLNRLKFDWKYSTENQRLAEVDSLLEFPSWDELNRWTFKSISSPKFPKGNWRGLEGRLRRQIESDSTQAPPKTWLWAVSHLIISVVFSPSSVRPAYLNSKSTSFSPSIACRVLANHIISFNKDHQRCTLEILWT